ncbi:MAG TPA: TIGR01212 family radical SAM protein [Lachnospiraceae bacterium]|nr:TIGR01212 family radical SAM protein [Lachnospiraceae bacterium]
MKLWNDKPYHSLDYELKERFHEKVYRLALNAGMTCPNRDGRIGYGGCIFCSGSGSGDFASDPALSVTQQIETGRQRLAAKRPVNKYIAYFQAYTNTYAPVSYLRKVFTEAILHPDIVLLSIATRPDCLEPDVLRLLAELNRIKPVWVELGLQTVHEDTAAFIRRGYSLPVFADAVSRLRLCGIEVITHVILGLPGEDKKRMLETIQYLNAQDIQGIKLQLLHILKGTDLALYYEQNPFPVFTLEEYADTIVSCIQMLRPDIVVHRLTGDGPKELLIAPLWSSAKRRVLNTIHGTFRTLDTWQGKYYNIENKENEHG